MAAAVMAISANAQNEFKCPAEGTIADGATIVTNDDFTVKAIYAGSYAAGAATICDIDFVGYFEFRTDSPDPTADNDYTPGAGQKIGLSVEVTKAVDLSFYYRRQKGSEGHNPADNKDMLCISATTGEKVTNTITLSNPDDAEESYALVKGTFTLVPGKYVFYRRGSTMRIYGMTWVANTSAGVENITAAEDENAPIYNLQGVQVDENYKGIVIKNGKKYINK